jgi:hypothetical protein
MMPIILLERLQQLLQFAKDPKYRTTALENVAAARELVDTAYHLKACETDEYRTLRMMCTTAALVVSNADLARSQAAVEHAANPAPKTYTSFSDGVRAVQVLP